MFFFRHIHEIRSICKDACVSVLYATGDVLHDQNSKPETLELVVNFMPEAEAMYYHHYYLLQAGLSELLQVPVEITDFDRLKNVAIRRQLLQHAEVIYNRSIVG